MDDTTRRTGLSRRHLLAGMGAMSLMPVGTLARSDPFSGEALFGTVKAYAGMGVHETGSDADRMVSVWQETMLRDLGYQVETSTFSITRPVYTQCVLSADGAPVEAAAQIPSPHLDAPVAGAPGRDFAFATVTGNTIDTADNLAALHAAFGTGARAVIALCSHDSGRLQLGNVSETLPGFPVPVILAGGADGNRLRNARTLSLTLAGRMEQRTGTNVVARIERRGRPYMIISTPQSGWTQCGGERGPGLAYFQALAHAFAQTADGPSLCLVSNSGHEFHNLGARHLHEKGVLPAPDQTRAWLHLGAGIACRDWRVGDGKMDLLDQPAQGVVMAPAGRVKDIGGLFQDTKTLTVPHQRFLVGELIEVVAEGYPDAVGLVGRHSHHHVPGDTEATTSPETLELRAGPIRALAGLLAGTPL